MISALSKIAFDWGIRCFGTDHMKSKRIRALRFLEEAIELAQACDVDEDKVEELVRIVYTRPAGSTFQEVGGTMVTLCVLCETIGIDVEQAYLVEVRRCLSKTPEHFRARNEEKIKLGLSDRYTGEKSGEKE